MGMHMASKIVKTWLWTSLIWGAHSAGHGSWDADEPDTLKKAWPPLQSYGMVVASDFQERDPAPWAAYKGKGADLDSLGDALKAVDGAMGGYQWCGNPYIENQM